MMISFSSCARAAERYLGRTGTFLAAVAVVAVWAASGPFFDWSDSWQLVINTGTTIVTFLMVFVIQNTQTRDTQAIQLKLDELILVNPAARNALIGLEKDETELTEPQSQTYKIEDVARILGIGRNQAHEAVRRGDIPSITIGSRQRVPKPALEKLLGGPLP